MATFDHVPKFGDAGGFVAVGDNVTWSRDGFDFRATVHADDDTSPTDYDCYSAEQIAAWRADEWRFVGVEVTASAAGVELGDASLWGVDCNFPGGTNDHLREVAADLETEALAAARAKLEQLRKVQA
jgi:hypothetical protein